MKTKQKMLTKPITAGFASIFFILKVSKMGLYHGIYQSKEKTNRPFSYQAYYNIYQNQFVYKNVEKYSIYLRMIMII